jgi:hypothetical protein
MELQGSEARLLTIIQKQNSELKTQVSSMVINEHVGSDNAPTLRNSPVITSRSFPTGSHSTSLDKNRLVEALSSDDIMRGIQISDQYI